MDDFNVSSLHESRNEWCSKLITILTPLVIDGYKSILEDYQAVQAEWRNGEVFDDLPEFRFANSKMEQYNH
jgi:hypothetical protein